jgi:hypothetical protein
MAISSKSNSQTVEDNFYTTMFETAEKLKDNKVFENCKKIVDNSIFGDWNGFHGITHGDDDLMTFPDYVSRWGNWKMDW